jgi:hypothetical protein
MQTIYLYIRYGVDAEAQGCTYDPYKLNEFMHIHNEKILGFLARQIGHVAALSNSMGTLTYELKHMGALTYELAPLKVVTVVP